MCEADAVNWCVISMCRGSSRCKMRAPPSRRRVRRCTSATTCTSVPCTATGAHARRSSTSSMHSTASRSSCRRHRRFRLAPRFRTAACACSAPPASRSRAFSCTSTTTTLRSFRSARRRLHSTHDSGSCQSGMLSSRSTHCRSSLDTLACHRHGLAAACC